MPQFFAETIENRAASCLTVLLDAFPFGLKIVEEERADDLHDVAFAGVVRALLAAFFVIHDALEEGTKDRGRDARPGEIAAAEQRRAHGLVEDRCVQAIRKQPAVDIGERREIFVQSSGAFLGRTVEDFEKIIELLAKVAAIFARVHTDVLREGVGLEYAGILGKEAEQDADEQPFELFARETAGPQIVMQLAHARIGFGIGGIFRVGANMRLPEHEGEIADMPREIGQRKAVGCDGPPFEKWQVLFRRLGIVEHKPREVRNEDEARDGVKFAFAGQVLNIGEGLNLGGFEAFSLGFVLHEKFAAPEHIDGAEVALEVADVDFERGQGGAAEAKDVKEFVPEGLFVGALRFGLSPGFGKAPRPFSYFRP